MSNLNFLESIVPMPLLPLPVRSTVVSTKEAVILISPGSKLTRAQLESIPNVTDIVANNCYHSAGIGQAVAIFPKARVWGSPGLAKIKPLIPWTHELRPDSWLFGDELEMFPIEGMPTFNEVVFLHRETRSLIVSDLCFNLVNESGFGAWLILSLFGTYKKFGVSRLFLKRVVDRPLFEKSLRKLLSADFDQIVVSHGVNVIHDGKDLLIRSLQERGFHI